MTIPTTGEMWALCNHKTFDAHDAKVLGFAAHKWVPWAIEEIARLQAVLALAPRLLTDDNEDRLIAENAQLYNAVSSLRFTLSAESDGIAKLRAENAALRGLVRDAEWSGKDEVSYGFAGTACYASCPWCECQARPGHTHDCPAKPYLEDGGESNF